MTSITEPDGSTRVELLNPSIKDIGRYEFGWSDKNDVGATAKRGLSEDVVVAPYATALAAMVQPEAAIRNFARLAKVGAGGRYCGCCSGVLQHDVTLPLA